MLVVFLRGLTAIDLGAESTPICTLSVCVVYLNIFIGIEKRKEIRWIEEGGSICSSVFNQGRINRSR